jgi:hypothetical protein
MDTIKSKWTGIRPILMHNGQLADWSNPITQQIKAITASGTKNRSEAEWERLEKLEWLGGLYWDEKDGPIIPGDNIERCIQLGAKKARLGKEVASAVLCTEPYAVLNYDGPRDREKLYAANGKFALRQGISIKGSSRLIRVRPMFPSGWTLTFEVEFDSTILNRKQIMQAMINAGALVGLGDWKPKFGRFLVEEL